MGETVKYETDFTLTENPMVGDGGWTRGLAEGLDWTNPATNGSVAYGTQTIHTAPPFDDSIAHRSGFANDHLVEITVFNNQTFGTADFEIETYSRLTISAHSARGYEGDWINTGIGTSQYALAEWNGALNDFTILGANPMFTGVATATGDKVRQRIIGKVIHVYSTPLSTGIMTELGTYDTSGDASPIATGQPGFGFWDAGGDIDAHRTDFAVSHFLADDGLAGIAPTGKFPYVIPFTW